MSLYFLVEGRRTERKVYPKWLEHLLPNYSRVDIASDANSNNYYLISGNGYPSILNHLKNAIEEINVLPQYKHLFFCIDADDETVEAREAEVFERMESVGLKLENCQFHIIVQNRCIETWFPGNRSIYSRQPTDPELVECTRYYNVHEDDPEHMGFPDKYKNHASFHLAYLQAMLKERNITFTKKNPGEVTEPHYLNALIKRTTEAPEHLKTFQKFHNICRQL